MDIFQKTESLPQDVKTFFSSDTPRLELETSCFLYGINDEYIDRVSGPIGLIFVKEMRLSDLPHTIQSQLDVQLGISFGIAYEINKRIFSLFPDFFNDAPRLLSEWEQQKSNPVISEDEAYRKVLEVEPWILEDEKEKQDYKEIKSQEIQKDQQSRTNLTISQALKTYPELGEQLITQNHIALKTFPEPVRPSIKNWLSDYTFTLGYDPHTSIQRGDYIFKNQNTRDLSFDDRQRLSFILKAYDENTPVEINTNTKQVVFPAVSGEQRTVNAVHNVNLKPTPQYAPPVPPASTQRGEPRPVTPRPKPETRENLAFSSPQKLPIEKTYQPMHIRPATINGFDREIKQEEKPLPKNVVNLKE